MLLPLAHFGHWWASLIFAVPFFVLVGALSAGSLIERRRANRSADPRQERDSGRL